MNKQMQQIILKSSDIIPIIKELAISKKELVRQIEKYDNISITNIEYTKSGKIKIIDSPYYRVEYLYSNKGELKNIIYTVGNIIRTEVYKNKILMSSIDKILNTDDIIRVCEYEVGKLSYINRKYKDKNVIYEYSYNEYGNKESILKQEQFDNDSITHLHNYEYDNKQRCIKHTIYLNEDTIETRMINYQENSKDILYLDKFNTTIKSLHLEYTNMNHSDIVTYFEEKDEDGYIIKSGSTTILDSLNIKIFRDSNGRIEVSYIDTDEVIYFHDIFDNTNYIDYDVFRKIVSKGLDNYEDDKYKFSHFIYNDNRHVCSYSRNNMNIILYNQYGIEYKINLRNNIDI